MKVLHIASGDLWAGAEVQLFTLAKALDCIPDVDLEIVLLNHGRLEQELRSTGIRVSVLDETKFNGIKILFQLVRVLRKTKPDLVHTHRLKENILGSIAAAIAGNFRSIRTAHGAPEHPHAWHHFSKRIILFLDWFCGRFLQKKIIAVSGNLAGILAMEFPIGKISIIENGIDVASFSDLVKIRLADTTYVDAPFKIGIAGRLVPIKRVDLFIRAAAQLLNEHPKLDLNFYIFGDGPLREDLEVLSRKLKMDDKIHFEGHCENMPQKLRELDILLMTSDHEGLPMILLEAMVLRTPVIAHAVGGIPTLLDQGKYGVLVTDHRPHVYAEAIYSLIKDRVNYTNIAQKAFDHVTTHYSSKKNAAAYHEIYSLLIAKR